MKAFVTGATGFLGGGVPCRRAVRGRRPRLDGQRLRQHARAGRRRDVSAVAGRLAQHVRPDEVARAHGGGEAGERRDAQPGAIYGPGDHSELGAQLARARRGRLRFKALADVGVNAVHIDDAAGGLLLVHDSGRLGESYVLGGEIMRLGEMNSAS